MKRLGVVVVVLALLLVAAPAVLAKSTMTLDAYSLLFLSGVLSGEYETQVGHGPLTMGIPVMFGSETGIGYRATLFGIGAGVRYYIDGQVHDGFYVGGYGQWAGLGVSDGISSVSVSVLAAIGVGGYKFLIRDRFVLDVGAQVGFPIYSSASAFGASASQVGGNLLTGLSVGLGVSF